MAAMIGTVALRDMVLSGLVALGVGQLAWLSVIVLRRGVAPVVIQQAVASLLTVWVLMWPVYVDADALWVGFALLVVVSLLAGRLRGAFWQHLCLAWREPLPASPIHRVRTWQLPPLSCFLIALLIAMLWFRQIPEFGFGLALCLSLAFPAAYWVDHWAGRKFHLLTLNFPAHPEQTLVGHLLFMAVITFLLCWSLHVYHGTDWHVLFIATLIAAMIASVTRALVPGRWAKPMSMITMGLTMWLL